MNVLEVSNLKWRKGNRTILNSVNWTVKKCEHVAIIGLNGSGKTSLLKLVTGYEWATSGQIKVLGETFGQTNIAELRKRIGWVSTAMDDKFAYRATDTSLEAVLSGKFASVGIYEQVTGADITYAQELLEQLNMSPLSNNQIRTLSQGEKRRIMIARALMAKPEILILDEPCNGLDIYMREQLLDTIDRLANAENGPTILFVTHHLEEIVPAITNALLIRSGEVIANGLKESTLHSNSLSRCFGLNVQLHWQDRRPWLAIEKEKTENF